MKTLARQHEHETLLGAPRDIQGGAAPVILQRADGDFIEAVLDDCKSADGRRRLQASRAAARNAGGVLKLFQPVQRQHHLALIEAWCDAPGEARIDPSRVAAAGLVVRRVRTVGRPVYQGWMRSKGRLRGWMPLDRLGGPSGDPLSRMRLAQGQTGVADIDHELRQLALQNEDALLNEHVVPMFVAPPDVCQAAGKTLYYGLVPTVSGEQAQVPAVFDESGEFGPDSADFRKHLVEALRGEHQHFPLAGEMLNPAWAEAAELATVTAPAGVGAAHWQALKPGGTDRLMMQRLLLLLRQLGNEFDAFEGGGAAFRALRDELAAIRLPLVLRAGETVARSTPALDFLRQAARVLVERDPEAPRPEMPYHWEAMPEAAARRLRLALSRAVGQRFAEVNPAPGRFEEAQAQYVVRSFLRLKPEGHCPERTVWSEHSAPFVIAPWYEGSGAPPVKIELPDVGDRALLKSLKPNVSFVLPASMQHLLSGNPKDLMEGKPPGGSGLGIGWICSFSIPIITICAFIVLSIFLGLFDLFFRWMAFIKICLPYPKKGGS